MAQAPFVRGQHGEILSPDEVKRLRERASGTLDRATQFRPVGSWTQGLAQLVDAWGGYRGMQRADRSESEGREGARSSIAGSPVLDALLGGQPVGGASPAVVSPAVAPAGASAEAIRAGLIARGMPEHVADGFVMNFQDESGLNPGINEIAPLVPGSRGGFGLAQWTGPRRVALEQYAAERGTSPADVDTQLDFLMTELQGPESQAAQTIFAAPDSATAADAVLRSFLRPADENVRTRSARYLGGQPGASFAAPNQNVVSALMGAQSDPWVREVYGPAIDALIGQQMNMQNAAYQQSLNQADPMYQAQLGLAQAQLDAALNPPPAAPNLAYHDGRVIDMNTGEAVQDYTTPQGPVWQGDMWWDTSSGVPQALTAPPGFSLIPPDEAAMMGLPEGHAYQVEDATGKISAIGGGGVNVNVGGDGMPGLGSLSTDYGYRIDPATNLPVIAPETGMAQAAPVPGSPAARAIEDAEASALSAQEDAARYASTVTRDIGTALGHLDSMSDALTGEGIAGASAREASAGVPGTAMWNMSQFVDSAMSNLTLDTMNRMRESSPAGATGFGNMSDNQMRVIQGVMGNWKPGLPLEDQRMILNQLGNFYLDVQFGTEAERGRAVADGRMTPEENAAIQEFYWPVTRDLIGRPVDPDDGEGEPQRLRYDPATGTLQ